METRTQWGVRDLASGQVWWTYSTEEKAVAEAKRFPHDRDVVRREVGLWEKVDVPLAEPRRRRTPEG